MSKLYETSPLAIEIKALVNDSQGQPIFAWVTITADSIECVSQAQTSNGGGATVRMKSGAMLLVSNSYEDVSAALVGDAKQFSSDDAVEAEILAGQDQPAPGPDVGDIADAMPGLREQMGIVPMDDEEDDEFDDEDFDADYDTGSN
tara:strand:- start:33474 stop:33911 length:438 start_codon:yes stop_codon:yes gene_type:complete